MHLQLAAVHDDERACLARRDDKCRENRLAEGGSRRQNAVVVGQNRVGRALLLGTEFAVEGDVEKRALAAGVRDFTRAAPVGEEVQGRLAAAARQGKTAARQRGA